MFEVLVTVAVFLVVFVAVVKYGMQGARDAEWEKERKIQMKLERERWGGSAND